MGREIWGTYSVKDHLGPHAFLADLMFYDRLVLPVPEPGQEGEWEKWNWKRQAAFIEVLKKEDRVKTVPWAIETWDRAKAAGEVGKDAFQFTRTRLTCDLPKSIRGVTAVPTYSDSKEYVNDAGLVRADKDGAMRYGHAVAAMQLEFLVPEFDGPMEPEYLEPVLEYTSSREHKQARAAFWHWLRDFFGEDVVTDQESIDAAVVEMADLISDLRKALRWKVIKTRSQYLFLAGSIALGMFDGSLNPVAIGGIALSVGKFALERAADGARKEPAVPAALFAPDERSLPFKDAE